MEDLTIVKVSFLVFTEKKWYVEISILVLSRQQENEKYERQTYNLLWVFWSYKSCDQKLARLREMIFSRTELLSNFCSTKGLRLTESSVYISDVLLYNI